MISPGIYNVSNGFMIVLLFGHFGWSSCNYLAHFSDLAQATHRGDGYQTSLPSRVEREETLNTSFMGRLLAGMAHTCNPCLIWYHDSS